MAATTKPAKRTQGMNWIWLITRLAIYYRDQFCCVYCGRSAEEHGVGLTLDHVVAYANGGSNSPDNLVTCCKHCNFSKQDKTMVEWYRVLRARGINTLVVGRRIAKALRTPIDRNEGRRLAQVRKAERQAKAA